MVGLKGSVAGMAPNATTATPDASAFVRSKSLLTPLVCSKADLEGTTAAADFS